MNPLSDPSNQQPKLFSARLGELAGKAPQVLPFPTARTPGSRLQAILAHLHERSQAKEDAMHKLKLNEFVAPE